jgi:GNAT superfamily N-acetyltransferase
MTERITYKIIDKNNISKITLDTLVENLFKIEQKHYNYRDNASLEKYYKEHIVSELKKGVKYFIIYEGNNPVGRAKVNVINKEFVLNHLLVLEKYRKKGIGTKLMIRVVGYAKANNFKNVIFKVANETVHNISKRLVSRNTQKSSIKYKYVGNTSEVNHEMPSVINMKKEVSYKKSKRPGR